MRLFEVPPYVRSAQDRAAHEVRWFRLAAEQGSSSGQFALGVMYEIGLGVSRNYEQAFRWYQLAANQGLAVSQLKLGVLYYDGRGVREDYEQAMKWFRLAAEQGLAQAQTVLGSIYERGYVVPQDYVQAHMWINLAAASGSFDTAEDTRARDNLAQKMTPDQIAEAQKLAREWKPKTNTK